MRSFLFIYSLLLALPQTQIFCQQPVAVNDTIELPKTSEKDVLLAEIKLVQDELALNQRKLNVLEQVRIASQTKNQTLTRIDAATLQETLSAQSHSSRSSGQAGPGHVNIPIEQGRGSHSLNKEKSETMSFMNKVLKKMTVELQDTIKDMAFLPIKSIQRNPDEPAITALIVFLTTENYLLIYDVSGTHLLTYKPNHQIKEFAVNVVADDYHIATLGTDNTIRVHGLNISRIKDEDPMDAYTATDDKPKTAKREKVKFRLDCGLRVEYIYDLEHNSIVPEALFQEIASRREEKDFGSLSQVIVRTQRLFACRKGDNTLVLVYRNGTFRGTQEFSEKLIGVQRFFPNPLYATQKTIGFLNPATLEASPLCDPPGDNVVKIELDLYSSSHFHVLVESGDILSYEFRQGTAQCRLASKRSIGRQGDAYNVHSAKNFLFAQKDKRGIDITAYNITELQPVSHDHLDTFQISLYPFKTDQDQVTVGRHITTRSGYSSSFIGAHFEFQNGTSTFTLYEVTIATRNANDWLDAIRLPLIIVAVLLVVGYQFYSKKNVKGGKQIHDPRTCRDHDHSHETGRRSGAGAGGRSRQSMEEMAKQYGSRDLDSLKKELAELEAARAAQTKRTGRKNVSFEDDDSYDRDEYQDLLTKKNR